MYIEKCGEKAGLKTLEHEYAGIFKLEYTVKLNYEKCGDIGMYIQSIAFEERNIISYNEKTQ